MQARLASYKREDTKHVWNLRLLVSIQKREDVKVKWVAMKWRLESQVSPGRLYHTHTSRAVECGVDKTENGSPSPACPGRRTSLPAWRGRCRYIVLVLAPPGPCRYCSGSGYSVVDVELPLLFVYCTALHYALRTTNHSLHHLQLHNQWWLITYQKKCLITLELSRADTTSVSRLKLIIMMEILRILLCLDFDSIVHYNSGGPRTIPSSS